MVQIRTYQPQDADAIADLYHAAVHAIDPTVYSKEQQEAWAPTPPDKVFWKERLAQKQPFVAWREGRIVGFMELEADGHIDCAYTHPAFQGQGVAAALYAHLEANARQAGMARLYVEASHLIRPFFERRGFHCVQTNQVCLGRVSLTNFTLEKPLSEPSR